jgi:hemoglobin
MPKASSREENSRLLSLSAVDDLFVQLKADPNFARFATGRSRDSHMRARQLIVDQLCALSGGPCVYIGRDMKTVHAGLGITESEWQANMKYTAAACDKNKVLAKEKEELLALMSRFKEDIVERPNR